MWTRG